MAANGLAMTEQIHRGVFPQYQLHMVWPRRRLEAPPVVQLPAGYGMRTYRHGDESNFFRLMSMAGFDGWNEDTLLFWVKQIVPNGWFFVVEHKTGDLVATSMAMHHPAALHPFGGELAWVAGHPAHRGKAIGTSICAAVTGRLLGGGYERIYLKTDDWRLPALKTYFNLGFVPFMYAPEMHARWQEVCERLEWPFRPEEWNRETNGRVTP